MTWKLDFDAIARTLTPQDTADVTQWFASCDWREDHDPNTDPDWREHATVADMLRIAHREHEGGIDQLLAICRASR